MDRDHEGHRSDQIAGEYCATNGQGNVSDGVAAATIDTSAWDTVAKKANPLSCAGLWLFMTYLFNWSHCIANAVRVILAMMHTDHLYGANPVVAELVQRLLAEDCRYDAVERRSTIREHLVRPITIRLRESDREFPGFSRNICSNGICIITSERIEARSFATIRIHRLEGDDVSLLAECRWSKPFGNNFFMTGWHFLGVGRTA